MYNVLLGCKLEMRQNQAQVNPLISHKGSGLICRTTCNKVYTLIIFLNGIYTSIHLTKVNFLLTV